MLKQNTLATAFADLVETLAAEGKTAEVLQKLTRHSVTVLDVAASGVLCVDDQDRQDKHWLHAASDDDARSVQQCEMTAERGPCLESICTGKPVTCVDVEHKGCWPELVGNAHRRGFRTIQALPMRADGQTIGGLSLYRTDPTPLSAEDVQVAQALADVAAASIHHQRTLKRSETRTRQLETALHSRVVIEQAKGVIASNCELDPAEAFKLLRGQARSQQQPLKQLAAEVVTARNASPVLSPSGADGDIESRRSFHRLFSSRGDYGGSS